MLDAVILGLIQALTEFLPVSSSGHLKLGHAWLGYDAPDDLLFDVLLHVGTLVAVFFVYRKRIGSLIAGVARGVAALPGGPRAALAAHEGLRYLVLIIIATLPTAVIGLALEDWVETGITSPRAVGGLLLVNGAILFASRWTKGEGAAATGPLAVGGLGPRQALLIGIVQGIAVLPGISRSGSTIVAALALGAARLEAAEFSFFLSIPAILGAVILKVDPELLASATELPAYLAGASVSAIGGVAALTLLLGVVRSARLHRFAFYCWLIGLVAVIVG
ncbi:MAG: undecaprenyl-diphosphate phosphatase [Myxococcales bacterium]|nr:undecaprenyl-diphosphate phosphatase [Myxococcales bacterium]MCB9519930.1 undecaprenyl-diphosphate phosphatase [Myxococcales bacterium]MCB9533162.1 undecaprenyl-diphosphate phosphatase [Myxococcales bacterium]